MDMSKYKSLFMSDTGDHLDSLEEDLVALEQKHDDIERIHEVFRHLHSVKGMAASMGYDEMAQLAHRLEDLIASHREKSDAVSPDEVDLLLRGLDLLRRQLKAVDEDRPLEAASEDLLTSIEGLIRTKPKQPVFETQSKEASAPKQADREPRRSPASRDVGTFLIEASLPEGTSAPSVRAFLVYRRLAELGEILHSDPGLEDMRAGRFAGSQLSYRLATGRGVAEIRRVTSTLAELEEVEIHLETPEASADQQAETRQDSPAQAASKQPGQGEATEGDKLETRPKAATIRMRTDLLDFIVNSVGELITLRSYFEELSERLDAPELREGVRRLNQVVRKLHDRVMEMRMVPISLLTKRLPRVCRDIARSRGKKIAFSVKGEDVELDRALVESLDTPVLHLLRNAVDHGIESPDERRAAGKVSEGSIKIEVKRDSDRVLLTLADDGRGIDPHKVLGRAREMGLVTPETEPRQAEDIFDLLFKPGFSTNTGVSEVSGRGVGLDAVRNSLASLGGRVKILSDLGVGTRFVLDSPLTLAILHVLLVEAGEHLLAFPVSRVLRASTIHPGQSFDDNGAKKITLGGQTWPVLPLRRLVGGVGPGDDQEVREALLIGDGDRPTFALGVKRIMGHKEVVLKGVGFFLRNLGPFGGSTILGDGRPVLVLDVDRLLRRATATMQAPPGGV